MAIETKPTHSELMLYDILRHPALCGEFIRNIDNFDRLDTEEEFKHSYYQNEILCDFNPRVSLCCARAVGKCLDKSAMLLNTKTGLYMSIENWYKSGGIDSITSIDFETFKQKTEKPNIYDNGIQKVREIILSKGYKTIVTLEHPFLTNKGWVKAENLKIGDYVATPSSLEYFGNYEIDDSDLSYIAHFIAEGTYKSGSISTNEKEVVKEIEEFAKKNNITYRIKYGRDYWFKGVYRLRLLEKFGLRFCHSYDKFIPKELFMLSRKQVAFLLNRLFGDDGWCCENEGIYEIGYGSTSETLARDIQHLLLRFGIVSSLSFKKNNFRGSWNLSIKGIENCRKFLEIGFIVKRKQEALERICENLESLNNTSDIIPIPNFREYKITTEQINRNNSTRPLAYYPTRIKANRVINKDENFLKFENADIVWLKVVSVENIGESQTYSIECPKYNTLVADNIYSHNTLTITDIIEWILSNKIFPDNFIVYTVPSLVHLEPVFTELIRMYRNNSFLENFIEPHSGINSSNHSITLKTGSMLLCRIAGQSNTGANVVGLHTPFIAVDEAGYFPHGTFQELQPSLNTWQPGYRMMTSGVPTGLRENNILYQVDRENPNYTKHRISAYENPRVTKEDEEAALIQYGGKESDDFIHYFLGQHGKPVFSLFDRATFGFEQYPVYHLEIDGIRTTDLSIYLQKMNLLPSIPNKAVDVIIGIDLGYTEPTAIIVMYLDAYKRLRFHARIKLTKVSYPIQEKIIDIIDTRFAPSIIGVDRGNIGVSVIQNLWEHRDYVHKNYKKVIYPVDFSAWLVLGTDSDGAEVKSKTKPFAVTTLQDYTNNHKILYSTTDMEMVVELERMTYTKNDNGDIAYKTLTPKGGQRGEDHFTSALLCGVTAYYLNNEFVFGQRGKKKLFKPTWVR